jgi:hypothetical protein
MIPAMLLLVLLSVAPGADEAQLARGDVVASMRSVANSDVEEAIAKAVIDAPPALVWSIVSDCGKLQTWMPAVIESRLLKTEAPVAADGPTALAVLHCRVVVDVPLPFTDLVSVMRWVNAVDPGKMWRRRWTLVEGDFHSNDGDWTVLPWGSDGTKSLAIYRMHAKPRVPLPDAVLAFVQQSTLPDVMHKLRAEAARSAR